MIYVNRSTDLYAIWQYTYDTLCKMGVSDPASLQGKGTFGVKPKAKTCNCKLQPIASPTCHLTNTNE